MPAPGMTPDGTPDGNEGGQDPRDTQDAAIAQNGPPAQDRAPAQEKPDTQVEPDAQEGPDTQDARTGPDAPDARDSRQRLAQAGTICFALGIAFFIAGATAATARNPLPNVVALAGQALLAGWPLLTLAAAWLRWRGAGPRDWLFRAALVTLLVPLAAVATLLLFGR